MDPWLILVLSLFGTVLLWPVVLGRLADALPNFLKRLLPVLAVAVLVFTVIDYLRVSLKKQVVERFTVVGASVLGATKSLPEAKPSSTAKPTGDAAANAPDERLLGGLFADEARSLSGAVAPFLKDVRANIALALAQGADADVFLYSPTIDFNTDLKITVKKLTKEFAFNDTVVEKLDIAGVSVPVDALLRPLVRTLGQRRLRITLATGAEYSAIIASDTGEEVWRVTEAEAACLDGLQPACSDPTWSPQVDQARGGDRLKRLLRAIAAKLLFHDAEAGSSDASWIVKANLLEGRSILINSFVREKKSGEPTSWTLIPHARSDLAARAKAKFDTSLGLLTVGKVAAFTSDEDLEKVRALAILGLLAAQGAQTSAIASERFASVQDVDARLTGTLTGAIERFDRCGLVGAAFPLPQETAASTRRPRAKAEAAIRATRFYAGIIDQAASILASVDGRLTPKTQQNHDDQLLALMASVQYVAHLQRAQAFECADQLQLAIRDEEAAEKDLNRLANPLTDDLKIATQPALRGSEVRIALRKVKLARQRLEQANFTSTRDPITSKLIADGRAQIEKAITEEDKNAVLRAKYRSQLVEKILLDAGPAEVGNAQRELQEALGDLKDATDIEAKRAKLSVLLGFVSLYKNQDDSVTHIGLLALNNPKARPPAFLASYLRLRYEGRKPDPIKTAQTEQFRSLKELITALNCFGNQAKTALTEGREVFEGLRAAGEWSPADLQLLGHLEILSQVVSVAGERFQDQRHQTGTYVYGQCLVR